MAAACFFGYLVVTQLGGSNIESTFEPTELTAISTTTARPAASSNSTAGDAPTSTTAMPSSTIELPPANSAHIVGHVDLDPPPLAPPLRFSGRLPEGEATEKLLNQINLAYSDAADVKIETDPNLPPQPWLEVATSIVPLLATVSKGTLTISSNGIAVAGLVPSPELPELFVSIGTGNGLDVNVSQLTVTGLAAPSIHVEVEGGKLTLRGFLPSQQAVNSLNLVGAELYGDEGVDDQLVVDKGTHPTFWMITMPSIIRHFEAFSGYEIEIVNSRISGRLDADIGFATESADLSPEALEIIPFSASLLARDPRLIMTVDGHTDSTGPAELNQVLSEDRAKAVIDEVVAFGIDRSRLRAVGHGPDRPIASNDTPEGRARNRRVEFRFETAQQTDPADEADG